jgi:GNAT superfamily N-acetyltransferase
MDGSEDKAISLKDGTFKEEKSMDDDGFILWYQDGSWICLKQIFVDERERRKGIGSKLFSKFEDMAKKKNMPIYTISSCVEGEVFYDFLINKGFTKVTWTRWEKTY